MTARNGPGDSNAGPVAGDRRTADKRSGQLESTARTDNPPVGRTDVEDVRHQYVTAALVTAGSGRARWLALYACAWCGAQHVAHARLLSDVLRRRASCGRGWLLLHPVATTGKRSA